MQILKKAMRSILEEAARAAADGALHPQTLVTDEAARWARSEARGARLVYIYVYVNDGCKTCLGMGYVGKRCAEDYAVPLPTAERGFDTRDNNHRHMLGIGNIGRQPTKFDTHYQKHPPMSFCRTLVYSYVGPHGDLPTRIVVAAVERAVWKVLDDAGMAGLNSAVLPISVLPLTPFVREDSDQWRAFRTELRAYKEERGDLRVLDGCTLGARMRQVRLERGLGDTAEEQWLTDQGFDWEADQESRAERNQCARQWPLVRDMIAWMETNGRNWPRTFRVAKAKGVGGATRTARIAGNALRSRWTTMRRVHGGVSLNHAKRIDTASVRVRRRGVMPLTMR